MTEHRPVAARESWPALALDDWLPTCQTLHMWTQIVGKVRLALAPPKNHWWHVPLYLTARGLTTSPMPHPAFATGGARSFEVRFDFVDHTLDVESSDGARGALPLEPMAVADFLGHFMRLLAGLNIGVRIWRMPVECVNPIPFHADREHRSYDPAAAHRFFRVLERTHFVLEEFAGRFQGKQSPVHFFWGSFDLALTRFSGRRAPARPGADSITREAYSHEVVSFGFWPGTPGATDAAFYAYAAPEPPGFDRAALVPDAARYDRQLKEYLLPYEAVRVAPDPHGMLLDFCQAAYDAGADLGNWDRAALDREACRKGRSEVPLPYERNAGAGLAPT